MNKIKAFFTDKRFIYGSGSVAVVVGLIAILVFVNIIVGALSERFTLKADLTENKIFELSEETKNVIKSMAEPVDLIILETAGSEDTATKELLQRYSSLNSNLNVKSLDPVKNPMSVQKYSTLGQSVSAGSVVVDNGKTFKVIPSSEIRGYSSYTQASDQFQAEGKITSALISLSKRKEMKIALSNGHGEEEVAQATAILKDDNIAVEKASTVTEGFSDKYDLYMIVSPKMDFSAQEIESLEAYLKSGKSVQFYLDVGAPSMPRLESYLADNGISAERNIVYETDSKLILNNTPYCFTPTIKEHPITKAIVNNNLYVIAYGNSVVKPLWDEKNSVKLETLLEASAKAYSSGEDTERQKGPHSLAVIATKTFEDGKQGKIFVMGSSVFVSDQIVPTNKEFLLGSINWQIDSTEALNIRPKSLSGSKLEMTKQDFIIWLIVLVVFLPLSILVIGLATWLRRRHL